MTFEPFFDEAIGQEIFEITDGALVEYRGQQAFMHCEEPTVSIVNAFAARVTGMARVLIGQRSCFEDPELARSTLIMVDGAEWLVADWVYPDDGATIWIALKSGTRE